MDLDSFTREQCEVLTGKGDHFFLCETLLCIGLSELVNIQCRWR